MAFTDIDKFKLLSAVGDPAVRDKLVSEIESAGAGQIVLPSAQLLVGNASNVGAGVALSGDATINNTGVLTLAYPAPKSIVVNLSSAQILALGTTPVVCIPSPGVGTATIITGVFASLTFVTSAYTADANIQLQYTNAAGPTAASISTNLITAAANANEYDTPTSSYSVVSNAAIVASCPDTATAAGLGTISLTIYYLQVPAL